MRILHVTDAYLPRTGGIEMHVHDLAQAQAAGGDEVDIVTMTRGRGALDAPGGATVIRPGDDAGVLAKSRYLGRHRSYGLDEGYRRRPRSLLDVFAAFVLFLRYAGGPPAADGAFDVAALYAALPELRPRAELERLAGEVFGRQPGRCRRGTRGS